MNSKYKGQNYRNEHNFTQSNTTVQNFHDLLYILNFFIFKNKKNDTFCLHLFKNYYD